MPFDPSSPKDRRRLRSAVEWSRKELRTFREKRQELVRKYVGAHYSDRGDHRRMPVNLMEMAINIYARQLAANNPQVMIETQNQKLKSGAADLEAELNYCLRKQKFSKTLYASVVDALFSVGIVKTGLHYEGALNEYGMENPVTKPFASCVDLDDWVHDASANHWESIAFCGHRYKVPLDYAKENEYFNQKAREDLKAYSRDDGGVYADGEKSSEIEKLSRSEGWGEDADAFEDRVELTELFLPRYRLVVTFGNEQGSSSKFLSEQQWEGPDVGPYHMLGFSPVPNNIMPLSPGSILRDLHELANSLFCKLADQAERQKTIVGYRGAASEEAERVQKAADGEMYRMDNPEAVREFKFGGADQVTMAFLIQSKDLFSYLGGNLDVLGGLGPQSETATQDKLIAAGASKRISDMQDRVVDFATEIVRSIGWYQWEDPLIDMQVPKPIPGAGRSLMIPVNAGTRKGDYYDYDITIDPYSMVHQSPASKLQMMTELFQAMVAPFVQQLSAQGIEINFESLLKKCGKYANVDMNDVLTFAGVTAPSAAGGSSHQRSMPSYTHRVNERVNRPGATTRGKDQIMMQHLLGGALQDAQAGAMTRPVG